MTPTQLEDRKLLKPVSGEMRTGAFRPAPAPADLPVRSRWRLQDAKARFSELVRRAHSHGPQHVTLHGRDAVVVIDAAEFQRLQGHRTGQLLIDALQASPYRGVGIAPGRAPMPVRAGKL